MLGKRKADNTDKASSSGKKQIRTPTNAASVSCKVKKRDRPSATDRDPALDAPLTSLPLSAVDADADARLSLKQVKLALKTLLSQLETIEREYTLLDRIWYKNAAQFNSAQWWRTFDGVRRSIKRLSSSSPSSKGQQMQSAKDRDSRARVVARVCVDTYTKLWAPASPPGTVTAPPPHLSQTGWPTIPKHTSAAVMPDSQIVQGALRDLHDLERILQHISRRCLSAGHTLILHLNTPPAPTFAPLVTALLALLASVHSAADSLTDSPASHVSDLKSAARASAAASSPIHQLQFAFTHAPRGAPSERPRRT